MPALLIRATRPVRAILARLPERLFPPDPGSLRLRQAARATIAAVITLALLKAAGRHAQIAFSAELFGFAMALLAAASVHDQTPSAQRLSLALAIAPATLATTLAALVRPHPLLAEGGLALVLSAGVYGSAHGPRAASASVVGTIAYMINLVGGVGMADIPQRFLIAALAAAMGLFAHSVLLPERPERVLSRIEKGVRGRALAIVAQLEAVVRNGGWGPHARSHLLHALTRLDEAVVAAEGVLGTSSVVRTRVLRLIALDLAVERLAGKLLTRLPGPTKRAGVAAALASLRAPAGGGATVADEASGQGLAAAVNGLAAALSGQAQVQDVPPVAPPVSIPPAAAPVPVWRDPVWRRCGQAALATCTAVTAGHVVSGGRWYWAAFAAYVVFLGTRSRTESLAKALQFMCGTTAGVLAGTLVATVLSGHDYAAFACIIVAVFLAFQASAAAYGVMIFWITIVLGLLFGLLGYFPPEILLLRLAEAAIGSACGVAVAFLLWPTRTSDVVRQAERVYLSSLATLSVTCAQCFTNGKPDPQLLPHALAEENRFLELRTIMRFETHGLLSGAHPRPWQQIWLLMACHYRIRELARRAWGVSEPVAPQWAAPLASAAASIAAQVRAFSGEPSAAPAPDAVLTEPAGHDPQAEPALLHLLCINADVRRLGSRHGVGTRSGA